MKRKCLIGVSKTTHTTHDAKDIVVSGVDADLSRVVSTDGVGGKDKLQGGVVDTGHIASSRRLVLLRAESKRVNVNTGVWVAGVVLVRLDEIEVSSFALGEAVLSVKLKLSGNNRVFSPAVHVEGSLGKNEDIGIGKSVGNLTADGSVKRAI